MDHYLVELYLPRRDQSALAAAVMRAQAVSDQLASGGTHVRYVLTIFVPVDEVCFHLFEAESAEAVARAAERASISSARIVGAVPLTFAEGDQRHHVSPGHDSQRRSDASAQVVEEANRRAGIDFARDVEAVALNGQGANVGTSEGEAR
jgi:hypothetical protein